MKVSVSYLQAIGYALLGFSVWVGCDVCMKLAGQSRLPIHQFGFLSSLTAVVLFLLIAALRGRLSLMKPNRIKWEIFRGLLRVAYIFSAVVIFTHLPLTTVYSAGFLGPMIISILAAVFLREPLSLRQVLAILAGFAGVLIAVNPSAADLTGGSALGYVLLPAGVLLFSGGLFMLRFMAASETDESMVFFPQMVMVAAMLPVCLWHFEPMELKQCLYVMAFGVFSVAGWLCMNIAYRHAPAAIVSPFHYSIIITGAILGYLFWGDVPTWNLVAGSAVIIAAGIYIGRIAHQAQAARAVGETG